MNEIPGTPYAFHPSRLGDFRKLADRVRGMRASGKLAPEVLYRLRQFFRIKNIYHSNAIEGNQLDVGETRQVVEQGLTLTGRPLKDQAEARNLSAAIDFLEELVKDTTMPIGGTDLRQIHALVLKGIADHAGAYRTVPVEIGGSAFAPPGPEKVPSEMDDFCDWLRKVSVPKHGELASANGLYAAAAAHTWLVTVHPFEDGNGRVARLLANLLLMRYRFPIAIVAREDRHRYYSALERSRTSDLTPVLVLMAECVTESLEEYERAAAEQAEPSGWAREPATPFAAPERVMIQNEYEVWKNAMALFRSLLRQTANGISGGSGEVRVRDFGLAEIEKYTGMRHGAAARRTWFCRLDFRRGDHSAQYLLFFGPASDRARERGCRVTLRLARENPPGSCCYERLDEITAPNVPDLREIGYDMERESFWFFGEGGAKSGRIETLGRRFFEQVLEELQPVMPGIPAVSLTEARTRPERSFARRDGSLPTIHRDSLASVASAAGSPGS